MMNARLLGFFSGFPTRLFTDDVARVLQDFLPDRDSLVFISCQPDNYAQNDEDSCGMHRMFALRDMAFRQYRVIDHRTPAEKALGLICGADCIFLMGGNATVQFQLITELGLADALRRSTAVILGVSAGAMNMGRPVVDIYESTVPYEGLGLASITVKAHYPLQDEALLQAARQVSMTMPLCLMKDESAIFITPDSITRTGDIYLMVKGEVTPLTQAQLEQMRPEG